MKRLFDVTVSSIFILLTFPLWMAIAIAIKLDSPGPVFYWGKRVGKSGEPFRIFKFRTMVANAAKQGPGITGEKDSRITRVGRWLRKYKLDEMPQLFNVILGDMSIVGPRPEDPTFVGHYSEKQREVLSVRPGMASPAFIKYRDEEKILADYCGDDFEAFYKDEILPKKLDLDLKYIEDQSFFGDLEIFLSAFLSIINRK